MAYASGIRDLLVMLERERGTFVGHSLGRLEILPEAGHFPHLDEPEAFVSILSDLIESTEAAELSVDDVRHRLKAGAGDSREGG